MKVRQLLKDVIDFHIHPGPDPFARLADSYEIAWMAQRYGMKAVVLKTQHYMGASTAIMLERLIPGIRIFGGLCLENAVGGLNPRAVEVAIACGAKVVWMPFLDSSWNYELYQKGPQGTAPGTYNVAKALVTQRGDQRRRLKISKNGHVLPEVEEILQLIEKRQTEKPAENPAEPAPAVQ